MAVDDSVAGGGRQRSKLSGESRLGELGEKIREKIKQGRCRA